MTRLARATLGFLLGGCVMAYGASLSPDESRCQLRTIGGTRVFIGAKLGCIRRCAREAFLGRVPAEECRPPFGGLTARCIAAREARAIERLQGGACRTDCPACYAGGDCNGNAVQQVGRVEAAIDALAPIVYCDDTASPDGLTRDEQRCADHVAAELRRFVLGKFACLRVCQRRVADGKILPAACEPPLPGNPAADAATLACIADEDARSVDHIDGTCQRGTAALECHEGRTGTGWTSLVGATVDAEATHLLCSSATGSFVDD